MGVGLGLQLALNQYQTKELNKDQQAYCRARLDFPQPRIALGLALRGLASACLDISDGLAQDLGHILQASHVGAELYLEKLPLSEALLQLPLDQALTLALNSGDDYELCFTISPQNFEKLSRQQLDVPLTIIGKIAQQTGLLFEYMGENCPLQIHGYQHFA